MNKITATDIGRHVVFTDFDGATQTAKIHSLLGPEHVVLETYYPRPNGSNRVCLAKRDWRRLNPCLNVTMLSGEAPFANKP